MCTAQITRPSSIVAGGFRNLWPWPSHGTCRSVTCEPECHYRGCSQGKHSLWASMKSTDCRRSISMQLIHNIFVTSSSFVGYSTASLERCALFRSEFSKWQVSTARSRNGRLTMIADPYQRALQKTFRSVNPMLVFERYKYGGLRVLNPRVALCFVPPSSSSPRKPQLFGWCT